jgi:hypothetical protein
MFKTLAAMVLWSVAFVPLNLFVLAVFLRQALSAKPSGRAEKITGNDDELIRGFVEKNLCYMKERSHDEGLGTRYERMMVDRLLYHLALKHGVKSVLESPADGITGVPGANSLVLADYLKCRVALSNPSQELLKQALDTWRRHGLAALVSPVNSPVASLPFANGHFDLAWSFCMLEKLSRPVEYLRELSRMSPGLVLIVVINQSNLGNALHHWYHRIMKAEWDHGHAELTNLRGLVEAFEMAGLEVLETGAVDVPPSIDTQDMPLKDDIQRVASLFGRSWEWRLEGSSAGRSGLLEYFRWLEDNLPDWFKRVNAHHVYVLGRVRRV